MNKVLIIEDDPFVADMLTKNLVGEGYQIWTAKDGEEGLALFDLHQPQVVITDLAMPRMDGFAVLEQLNPQVISPYSIIVLTGFPTDENIKRCYDLGIQTFLRKPVRIYELKGLIKRSFDTLRFSSQLKEEISLKQKAYDLLKSTFENIVEGCIVLDQNFHVQLISSKACTMLDIREEDVTGKPAASILGASFAGPSGTLIQLGKAKKKVSGIQTRIITPSSQKIPVRLSVIPMNNSHEESNILLLFQDLREEEGFMRRKYGGFFFGKMISSDPKMTRLFEKIEQVAPTNVNVLIEGETGTGKELVAREFHERSRRSQSPFHAVNCAAISPNLLESEFFGHERGAFTGATQTKQGRFELAHKGTLFLDEVAEIPKELQGKLLRVLQERTFERVGGTKSIEIDTRILAATNKNLKELVTRGAFRSDLYYRLNAARIYLPPLRERKHDIPLLVSRFIEEFNEQEQRSLKGITPNALQSLMNYSWPGNIRELRHVIEYAAAISSEKVIKLRHLPDSLQQQEHHEDLKAKRSRENETSQFVNEKERMLAALRESNFRKQKAAALLGMHRSTFYRKLKKYDL